MMVLNAGAQIKLKQKKYLYKKKLFDQKVHKINPI